MTETLSSLQRKIAGAGELESVVRTMKTVAASSIAQYERAVEALEDYYQTVRMGLAACLRPGSDTLDVSKSASGGKPQTIHGVVFGSDQGLVGRFNESLVEFVVKSLAHLPGKKLIWAVGERVQGHLSDASLQPQGLFPVPHSVAAITPLIGRLLVECEAASAGDETPPMYLFYNRPRSGATYEPVNQRLLPLDAAWLTSITAVQWRTKTLPEVMGGGDSTLRALIREFLFVSLFKACAESLASENASRLAAMQRAEKNIDDLLEDFNRTFHHLRQSSIDEELFDLISGFEALKLS